MPKAFYNNCSPIIPVPTTSQEQPGKCPSIKRNTKGIHATLEHVACSREHPSRWLLQCTLAQSFGVLGVTVEGPPLHNSSVRAFLSFKGWVAGKLQGMGPHP